MKLMLKVRQQLTGLYEKIAMQGADRLAMYRSVGYTPITFQQDDSFFPCDKNIAFGDMQSRLRLFNKMKNDANVTVEQLRYLLQTNIYLLKLNNENE